MTARPLSGRQFDVIGDVHGCADELFGLLGLLGYRLAPGARDAHHPAGRTAVFVGDLVGRGPAVPAVLHLVMGMVGSGHAICVLGNHDEELGCALRGNPVSFAHGLSQSLGQLGRQPATFVARVASFVSGLPSRVALDEGRLVVTHARPGAGDDVGGTDAVLVYGHTPVDEPSWAGATICVDTGCVYGGKLTALRYPERELVSVTAAQTYWLPAHRRS